MRRRRHLPAVWARTSIVVSGSLGLLAAACTPSYDGMDRLRAIVPEVQGDCDSDGVELDFGVRYVGERGDYALESVEVSGLDAACEGETVRLAAANGGGVLGTGADDVSEQGTARIYFDPVTREFDDDGDVHVRSNLEVDADSVRSISMRIGP